MSSHQANLQQAQVRADYYGKVVNDMCFWIGIGVGLLLGIAAERLMLHYVPESYWEMYASAVWIPVYLGGWLANTQLRDRIGAGLSRRLAQLEPADKQTPRALF